MIRPCLFLPTMMLLFSSGCLLDRTGTKTDENDGGMVDAGALDAGRVDGGSPDGHSVDASLDAGPTPAIDGGSPLTDAGPESDWWNAQWGRRRRLSIDNGAHDENLDDFPLLVVLESDNIEYARAGAQGEQIRFVDSDGTELPYEIERWADGGTSYVWVKVPRIDASSTDDYIWLYYDAPTAADGQDAHLVWAFPYRAVWHLGDTLEDSTDHGNDASGTAAEGAGVIGSGRTFAANGQHLVVPHDDSLTLTTELTLSTWLDSELTGTVGLLSKRQSCGAEGNYAMFIDSSDRLIFENYNGGWQYIRSSATVTDGWHWVTVTFNTETDQVRFYIDGVQEGGFITNTSTMLADTNALEIGRNGGCVNDTMDGPLDEVRLEATARSAAWIAAQFESMKNTYLDYGPLEARP